MEVQEFDIPVPWGHISVKAWGQSIYQPVVVTHGRMDNAGSFDNLIPLLPDVFYYICIDLPSHGRSSHFPPFLPIHTINNVLVYKLVLDYFKRGKYIILGHSYGAYIGQSFARLYPEYVKKIVSIDCISGQNIEPSQYKKYLIENFSNFILTQEKVQTSKKKTFTEEEIVEKIRNGRLNQPLSSDSARCIARRMLEPAGNGRYTLSIDHRMRAYIIPIQSFSCIRDILKQYPITIPYLIIVAKQSPPILSDMHPLLEEVEKWRNATIVFVDSGHDVHINQPEMVAPHIMEFLLKSEGKL